MLMILDASSLILLQKIGLLERIIKKFSFVITLEVYKEAVENGKNKNARDAYAIDAKIAEGMIKVLKLKSGRTSDDLMNKFGTELGESETIALRLERKSGIVAVDDHKAMVACNVYGIPFTTALAMTIEAKKAGIITLQEAQKMISDLGTFGRYKNDLIIEAARIVEGEEND